MEFENSFYIGYISKTRGLKGELQLFFEFEDYRDLNFETVFFEIEKKLIPFFVESYKVQSNSTAYVYLEDVDHIDKSQPLVRKKVYLSNKDMPVRDPDDFRMTDLKGFLVIDEAHGELGEIVEVHNYPQQFVAAVQYGDNELLFPLNEDILLSIDQENKVVEVDLPEGLVDIYS